MANEVSYWFAMTSLRFLLSLGLVASGRALNETFSSFPPCVLYNLIFGKMIMNFKVQVGIISSVQNQASTWTYQFAEQSTAT